MIGRFGTRFWGESIRGQLVAGIGLVYLLLMTLFVAVLWARQQAFLRGKAETQTLFQAGLAATSSLPGVMSNDLAGLQEIMEALRRDKGVRYAFVTDGQGRVLAHTDARLAGSYLQDALSRKILAGAPRPTLVFEGTHTIDAAAPILLEDRPLGWVRVARDLSDDNAHLRSLTRAGIVSTAIAIVIGTGFAFALAGAILRPLQLLLRATEHIQQNRLDERIPITTKNEVGVVTAAFNDAMDQLGRQIAERRRAEESLREQTRQIAEGASILAASAGEILEAVTHLAASATETAAAVSETTATVEQMRQTAQVSSQKSQQVADSAQNAASISQSGRQCTEQTTEDIERIHHQMEAIAESMVRLSEQSQTIAEIIATVDDLADQSNLLAVNAAIEAAKAGEQGKGFAVVAQEVKSLADQSRQATRQVRGILGDIQRATGAAVMATEQGSKAVEASVLQSGQAGESIQILAESVAEASQAAQQIAASSQQQMVGMDQVAIAMRHVHQASAQNVDSAKRMEASAQHLNELGQRLKEQVERYPI